jgi:hypothetical protein
MSKVEKTLVAIAVVGMVGFGFAIATLRGIPEAFDWDDDEESMWGHDLGGEG